MRYFHYTLSLWLLTATLAVAQERPLPLEVIIEQVEAGDYATALEALDARVAADVNDVQAHFMRGLVLVEQGHRAEAETVFLQMTRLFPALPEAYNNLAALYVERGDYASALQTLHDAIEHTANDADMALLRSNLGDLYIAMAIDAYRHAQAITTEDLGVEAKLDYLAPMLD